MQVERICGERRSGDSVCGPKSFPAEGHRVRGGVKLDFLPVEESMGTIAWESERDRLAKKAAKKNAREGNRILAAAASLMVTTGALAVWLRGPTDRV